MIDWIVPGALVVAGLVGMLWKVRRDARADLKRKAKREARDREIVRDEINRDSRDGNARDSLREWWSSNDR